MPFGWMMERRRRLSEVAAEYRVSSSEAVRAMIDDAYAVLQRERRREAARALGHLRVEDVPPAEELARQLGAAHETPAP